MGVLLAALGVYGVLAFLVSQQVREIGVRMALGATRGRIVKWLLVHAVSWAAVGLALGTAGAFVAAQRFRSMLDGVNSGRSVDVLSGGDAAGSGLRSRRLYPGPALSPLVPRAAKEALLCIVVRFCPVWRWCSGLTCRHREWPISDRSAMICLDGLGSFGKIAGRLLKFEFRHADLLY